MLTYAHVCSRVLGYADVCCEGRAQLHGYISALESDGEVLMAELKQQMDQVAALRGLSVLALLAQKYEY
jgi:hypothetical protein